MRMLVDSLPRRWAMRRALAPWGLTLVLVLALSACGRTISPGGGAPGQPTATASTTLTGCPAATQTVAWPAPPDVVLTTPFPSSPTTLRAGQALEVALPFGHLWHFEDGTEQPALALDVPAGYGDSGAQRCVWRFTAQRAGQVDLTFTMQALCPPKVACPLYIAILKAPISVV